MRRVLVEVTEQDIRDGSPRVVRVDSRRARVVGWGAFGLSIFTERFDCGYEVSPFAFEIEVPA